MSFCFANVFKHHYGYSAHLREAFVANPEFLPPARIFRTRTSSVDSCSFVVQENVRRGSRLRGDRTPRPYGSPYLCSSTFGVVGVFEPDPKYTWRNAGFPQTDKHPVVNVSWNGADAFATWLTSQSKKKAETVRYPLPPCHLRSRQRIGSGFAERPSKSSNGMRHPA